MYANTRVTQLHSAVLADLGLDGVNSFPSFSSDGLEKLPAEFAREYLAYNLVRKVEPFTSREEVPTQIIRDSLRTFMDTEHSCTVVNRHGRFFSPVGDHTWSGSLLPEAFRLARSWISATLMDVWPRWEELHYTGGASRFSSRRYSLPMLKWSGFSERGKVLSATPHALDFLSEVIPDYGPSWHAERIEPVMDSRFDFVAKTAKAVRFMAMEPEVNMLLQKCVGDAIRAGLLRQGLNLNDQSPNQQISLIASMFRNQATIDLSSASDCLSLRLLGDLLPERWWSMVCALRTPQTTVGNRTHKLQKVATMGNGFIFELQTLVYASLAYACTVLFDGRVADLFVYGDDIVVSDHVAIPLMELLEVLGFQPNFEKSFHGDVPFRESCGKHWYKGSDVTPFYIKGDLDRLDQVFRAFNGLMYWTERTGIPLVRAKRLISSWLPEKDRIIVPQSYSIDSGLHFPLARCRFPKRVVTKTGDVRFRFAAYVAESADVTERIDDMVKYNWWLRYQTAPIVDPAIWGKLHLPQLPGFPRERLCVRHVSPEKGFKWACRDAGEGEIA